MKLSVAIEVYVKHKQKLGFIFLGQAGELRAFAKAVGDKDLHELHANQVLRVLDSFEISTHTWRRKHSLISNLFKYWRVMGEVHTLPMPPKRGIVRATFVPYVYSKDEVRGILHSAEIMRYSRRSTVHPKTMRMLLLFLYATGARPSEAMALRNEDLDFEAATMRLRLRGGGTVRTLPIGGDLKRSLQRYAKWKKSVAFNSEHFFVREGNRPLQKDTLQHHFDKVLAHSGVARRDHAPQRPRLYDFRGTFAVHRISAWIRTGKNLNRLLPALAAYLGQADLNATERFLALTPDRFKKELDKLSPMQGGRWADDPEAMKIVNSL